jgi:hypothetical protein
MDATDLVCRGVETIASPTPPAHRQPDPAPAGSAPPAPAARGGKGRLAFLWGVSGSVLSAVGFVGLTLFGQYNDSLTELRRDLKHFNETSAELVKKESMQRLRDQLKEWHKEIQAAAVARAQMEQEWQAGQKERHEMAAELQRLRERLAAVEGRQAATPIVVPIPQPDK